MNVFTVFREDYDDLSTGANGSWDTSYRCLDRAKRECEANVRSLLADLGETAPTSFEWTESSSRIGCLILDNQESATVHTIMTTKVYQ